MTTINIVLRHREITTKIRCKRFGNIFFSHEWLYVDFFSEVQIYCMFVKYVLHNQNMKSKIKEGEYNKNISILTSKYTYKIWWFMHLSSDFLYKCMWICALFLKRITSILFLFYSYHQETNKSKETKIKLKKKKQQLCLGWNLTFNFSVDYCFSLFYAFSQMQCIDYIGWQKSIIIYQGWKGQ